MNILIVDDEQLARSRLQRLIEKLDLGTILSQASNGVDAIKAVEQYAPDVVLMDIQMPAMNGLEASRHISQMETPPAIIFTTAYDEFALDAIKVQAVDYLLKPVRAEALADAFSRLKKINKAQVLGLNENQCRSHISAKTHQGLQLIPTAHILAFRADQKYISVLHQHGEVLIDEPLKALEEEFAPDFIRVHRSALINKKFVEVLEKQEDGSMNVRLIGLDESIPVSRRHLAEVKRTLQGITT
ncbi:LytR/AlgR family response regulator transcription factor [Bermanella sp. R86510]|uniref:LytR/AlgR family response regulator transcription factor n=1 Tax=unclassified Bermanella TaxID=2627862 RepID=UPI0037CB104D